MLLLAPLAFLMQIGPSPHVFEPSALPIPGQHRKAQATPDPRDEEPQDRLAQCLGRGRRDPAAGIAYARGWLAESGSPALRVRANQCLGLLLSDEGDYAGAELAFGEAVSGIPEAQGVSAVPLMAMAGNAALAGGEFQPALGWFDRALAVKGYQDKAALGAIATDRARALVGLDRAGEAADALAQARTLAPADPVAWLLSATLARRNHDLVAAQGFIETAAALDPRDPATGLEAGVIAMLSGHEDAARKSWQSVLASAPDSTEAASARGYLGQLGPEPAAKPAPALDRATTPPKSTGAKSVGPKLPE